MWYPGRVERVNAGDGTFQVLYDDGEVEPRVALACLRAHVRGTLSVGTRVFGRYAGGDEWYPGRVTEVQDSGCYTIEYDDGETEADVPAECIKEPDEATFEPTGTDAEAPDAPTESLTPADAHDDDEDGSSSIATGRDRVDEAAEPTDSIDSDTCEEQRPRSPLPPAQREIELERPRFQPKSKPADSEMVTQDRHHQHSHQQQQQLEQRQRSGLYDTDEYTGILESIELLERRLGDAAAVKLVLSTLVKQLRAFPQATAELVHERGGEPLVLAALKVHDAHAVIQCYCFVLLRRLCFLCAKSTHQFLRSGIVALVAAAMRRFAEDAILQAAACGALAVFTRVHAGLAALLQHRVAELVLATVVFHKTYSIHTRQVHYYACEVLLELCELGDRATLDALCSDQLDAALGDVSPISLLVFLLRQGLSFDDRKASCAVGTLLMCLAANNRYAVSLILRLNGLPELSTVMAKFPTEPGIQKYSASASKEIALASVLQTPTKRVKERASEVLQESGSLEELHHERFQQASSSALEPRSRHHQAAAHSGRSRTPGGAGTRKAPLAMPAPSAGVGFSYPASPTRGAAVASLFKDPLSFCKFASPICKAPHVPSNAGAAAPAALAQRSSLVVLDSGGSEFYQPERKQFAKEERQSLLFETYGVHGIKRKQLKTHLVSAAEATWATPVVSPKKLLRDEMLAGPSAYAPPHSGRSDFLGVGAYAAARPRGYEAVEDADEPTRPVAAAAQYYYPSQQTRRAELSPASRKPQPTAASRSTNAKKKKRTTAFQVSVESETQLRVSKEMRSPFTAAPTSPSHKRPKNRAKATASGSRGGESFTAYAAKLFNDDLGGDSDSGAAMLRAGGSGYPLSAREQAELQERERLSFAEKLHKMIDKAKSTLAVSNVSSEPVGVRSSRSTASATRSARSKAAATASRLASPKQRVASPAAATQPPRPSGAARKTRVQSGGAPSKKARDATADESSALASPRGSDAASSQAKASPAQDARKHTAPELESPEIADPLEASEAAEAHASSELEPTKGELEIVDVDRQAKAESGDSEPSGNAVDEPALSDTAGDDDMYADEYNEFDDDAGGDEAAPDEPIADEDAQVGGSIPLDELLTLAERATAADPDIEPSTGVEEEASTGASTTEDRSLDGAATISALSASRSGEDLYADDDATEFASEPSSSRSAAAPSADDYEYESEFVNDDDSAHVDDDAGGAADLEESGIEDAGQGELLKPPVESPVDLVLSEVKPDDEPVEAAAEEAAEEVGVSVDVPTAVDDDPAEAELKVAEISEVPVAADLDDDGDEAFEHEAPEPEPLDVAPGSDAPAATPVAPESNGTSPRSDAYDEFEGDGDGAASPVADDDYADDTEAVEPSDWEPPDDDNEQPTPAAGDDYADDGDEYNDFEEDDEADAVPRPAAPTDVVVSSSSSSHRPEASGSTGSTPREVEDEDDAAGSAAPAVAAATFAGDDVPERNVPAVVDDDDAYAVEDEFGGDDAKPSAPVADPAPAPAPAAASPPPPTAPDPVPAADDAENEYEADYDGEYDDFDE
ncbi:hypothetical protein PybrP1_005857 [[Pythium] brassicae (nom. inval.)]|nr:hypothetical protein PybrP1_005857 [[Pythium] brassicae (nom. inval.)]